MYYNTNKHQKTKPGLVVSYDIWPGKAKGLFWFQCFTNLSLTYLHRHLPTYSPGTHTGCEPGLAGAPSFFLLPQSGKSIFETSGTDFYGLDSRSVTN